MARVIPNIALAFGLVGFAAIPAFASYAIFVGSNLTADGSTLLGGTGDEPSSHWLEIVPHRSWPARSSCLPMAPWAVAVRLCWRRIRTSPISAACCS